MKDYRNIIDRVKANGVFDDSVFSFSDDNIERIISFLEDEQCDFIEELIECYIDLFQIDYDDFVIKFIKLNEKYNYAFWEAVKNDMNLLEEFYTI